MSSIFTFWEELYIQIGYSRRIKSYMYGTCDFDDVNYFMRRGSLLKYIQEKQFKKM